MTCLVNETNSPGNLGISEGVGDHSVHEGLPWASAKPPGRQPLALPGALVQALPKGTK